jgi:hypothetical protein
MNNTSILTVAEEDCFPHFSRSKRVFIEIPALKAQKWESLATGCEPSLFQSKDEPEGSEG